MRRLYDTFHEPFRKPLRVPAAPAAAPAGAALPSGPAAAPPAGSGVQEVGGAGEAADGPGEEPLAQDMPLEEDEGDEEELARQIGYEQ